ncbi:hypothetical protein FEE95_02400 [Maribacter algarum]|uniref:Lipocalin-like domain-containing protein n=1 Tax=Maribacter algarum (ex Zhang et al. 2020) TaxID=2578118 RepID=A0A5S3PTH6_9FLAO|nr:hypothetical protein [Maribacter algarum]TMM58299.1 hypothetical protein FEE95_02400 [Maribacter algarum]
MKFPRILLALVLVFGISCKKEDNQAAIDSIIGHWHILDFQPDANSPENESQLAKLAIAELIARPCDPLEYTFKSNGAVIYKDAMKYLDISMGDNGVEVECASKSDLINGTFDFDGSNLTVDYIDGQSYSFAAALEGENFTVRVSDLSVNGVLLQGKLIFMRETDVHN